MFEKFHRQHQCTLQLVWRHGVLFVWVRLDVPFMQAITSSMLTSSSSRVSTFFLYTSLFIKPRKQRSNWVKSGDLGGQLIVLPPPPLSTHTNIFVFKILPHSLHWELFCHLICSFFLYLVPRLKEILEKFIVVTTVLYFLVCCLL